METPSTEPQEAFETPRKPAKIKSPVTMETPSTKPQETFETPCKPDKIKSPGGCETPVMIPASPFMKKVGYGTGVNVYLMNRNGKQTHSPWAIKKIASICERTQKNVYLQRLSAEAKILKELNHPNIVGFRAFTTANDGSKCLAMEYGGEQSLNDLIESRSEEGLGAFPVAIIEKVALHVARGLQYLHNEKGLLHGDMKSCNIVIKGDFETIKICDVGVSLSLDENMQMSDLNADYIGTEPWKPMEALLGGLITDKADIFAYGLTLWEMMTLSMPHLEMLDTDDDEEDTFNEEDFDNAYYGRLGTRPPLDVATLGEDYQRMVELFYLCTEEKPTKRPSAARIVHVLESNSVLSDSHDEVIVLD